MRNMWRLFRDDIKRITSNGIAIIIVLGLVLLPSVFSWYNIFACWDVFGNTGNLRVAVASADEGYQSDLVPMKVNMGEQVMSALRANDQLDWEFTTVDEAVEGAKSGKYYAAVVIPKSFSKDMMTFFDESAQHASIMYYTNEKKSAVAPKVTDQGADQVAYQINKVFTESISEVALVLSSSLASYADESGLDGRIGDLANHVSGMGANLDQAAGVLESYALLMGSAQQMADGSAELLAGMQDASHEVTASAAQAKDATQDIAIAMDASVEALGGALGQAKEGFADSEASLAAALDSAEALAAESSTQLRGQADKIAQRAAALQGVADHFTELAAAAGEKFAPEFERMAAKVQEAVNSLNAAADRIYALADSVDEDIAATQDQRNEIEQLMADAQISVQDLSDDYASDVKPLLDQLSAETEALVASLEDSAGKLSNAATSLGGSAETVEDKLGAAQKKLQKSADELHASAARLNDLGTAIAQALDTKDLNKLREAIGSDPQALATALSAPVGLDRHAVFPAQGFGAQMSPLYTTLAMWIGALLLVVAVKVNVSKKAQSALVNPKPYQMFLGRFGVFAVLSLMQTTCLAAGNLLFVGIDAVHPWLYMACFWISGLVFAFIIYTLVVSFANLGKAAAVLLLILQVASANGSFPLQLLPGFFQVASPYMPATHVIAAMRAAMQGVYAGDFWAEISALLWFLVPAVLLGLVLRKPLERLLNWYVHKVEESKLVA